MPHTERFKCRNCGNEFDLEVYSPDEAQKARDRGENVGPVRCPNPECGRTDLVKLKAA